MSVALLQNDRHVHEILDDRESAFHVLTWSALRYTAHSSRDDVGPHMKPYDEAVAYQDGNVEGGSGKKNMIQNGLKVIFHPSVLHKLIDDLRALFDLRYPPLSVTLCDDIHCIWKARNARRLEQMKCRDGLVRIFREWLRSPDWLSADMAKANALGKRAAQDTNSRPSKSQKRNDGGKGKQ